MNAISPTFGIRPFAGPHSGPIPRAAAQLEPNGGHLLLLDFGAFDYTLGRDHARMLGGALKALSNEVALWLLSPLVPAIRNEADVLFLRSALRAFEEEIAFEDRFPDLRTHRVKKPLVV